MAPLSKNNKEQVLGIHSFLVPDAWHTEGNRERVKVEVDLPGHHVKNTSDQITDDFQAMDEDEDDHHVDPLDMKPDAKDSSKPKPEPYRCRYDSTCTVAFRSVKVIHFIIRNPLCIGNKGDSCPSLPNQICSQASENMKPAGENGARESKTCSLVCACQ